MHIRYEDCSSSPGRSFCIGIQLSEISTKSTNEEWEVEFLVGKPVVHKPARLSRLGIYVNVYHGEGANDQACVDKLTHLGLLFDRGGGADVCSLIPSLRYCS